MYTLALLEKNKSKISHEQIASVYLQLKNNHDHENALKMIDIYEKLVKEQFVISFAGHFSAGKSSMINQLLDEEVLPNSPIPTSANIVKITSGKESAKVFFHKETPIEYPAPYDIEMIKEYCKNKDTIKRIELITENPFLPKGSVLIDTPGIDAADDADRLITESSLHIVDLMFYIMDYNHVQSEVNLHFLKSLQDHSIPFFVIINQIDKHNEQELPFSAFKNSVKQTFDQWNIKPKNIFYSSLVHPHTDHNQFEQIKETLFHLLRSDKEQMMRTYESVQQIIHRHEQFLKQEADQQLASFASEDGLHADSEHLEEISNKLAELNDLPNKMKSDYFNEINSTLTNAYLMPAQLRDKAENFLLAHEPGFKIGLFGSKKKTREEQRTRIKTFLHEVLKSIESSIQWKLRDKLLKLLQDYNSTDQILTSKIQQLSIDFTEKDLFSHMKVGAKVNGNYVLNYTNDISNDIKNKFKVEAQKLWNFIENNLLNQLNEQIATYENEFQHIEKVEKWKEQKQRIENERDNKLKIVKESLEEPNLQETVWNQMESIIKKQNETIKQSEPQLQTKLKNNQQKIPIIRKKDKQSKGSFSIENVIESIDQTLYTIENLPMFQEIKADLNRKRNSLQKRTVTIALFGAFSAGKSSFANALIGEKLLPSSPNPTTAVINRILPVTDTFKHGTVQIKLKDYHTLFHDLAYITKRFSPSQEDFHSLLEWVKQKHIHKNDELNKMYQAYLQAMLTGYSNFKELIGKTITISIDEFADYVTNEAKACYFEEVDLYYDCSLTQQGITLVDTPGADSINARHTNVSFEYIKYADAIFYVTYYNHALSRADKDFLMQLGRVKEAFELDKMFFIINASDLAQSEEDLHLVIQYVEEQLLQLGIRFPKIYPVSSKLSLENKLKKQSLNKEMQQFEKEFFQFINEDLVSLMTNSAIWDINRASKLMNNYLETIQLDDSERESYLEKWNEKQEELRQIVEHIDPSLMTERIIERITRQLHYVKERFSIRFHDIFMEFFNPTTVTESGRKATKQLQKNMIQLIDYAGYELLQEIRAVALRLESRMNELAREIYNQIQEQSKAVESSYILPSFDKITLETPDFKQALTDLNVERFNKIFATFKGTKAFFEKNEKEMMKESLFNELQQEVHDYVEEMREVMELEYLSQWDHVSKNLKQKSIDHSNQFVKNRITMITDPANLEEIEQKNRTLSAILQMYNKGESNEK